MNGPIAATCGLSADAIEKIREILAKYPNIDQGILYGSRAKGNFRPGSDVDLCLIAPMLSLTEKLGIETELDDLLLPWKIDLVLEHQITNPALLEHIERVGVELFRPEPRTKSLKNTRARHRSTQ
jgi:predicted nucleotidyltransferase